MGAQCGVIALIILAAAFCFYRTHRKKWAVATLPIAILPIASGTVALICTAFELKTDFTCPMIVIITSVVISCVLCGICAMLLLKNRKARLPYVIIVTLFNILLGAMLLNHYFTAVTV